jgi:hypothetical protein
MNTLITNVETELMPKNVLRVEFMNIVTSSKFGGKILRKKLSGKSYIFSGDTKKECIEKAKKAYRYSSVYAKKWLTVEEIESLY